LKFGFLIDRHDFKCKEFEIFPVSDFEKILAKFYEFNSVSKGWIYGPEVELKQSSKEKIKFIKPGPISCSSFYTISSTHEIKSNFCDDEHLKFLILGYSFLQGLYLIPEGHSYLGRVPYEPGKLNGLLLCGNDYISGMEKINEFYKSATPDERNQLFSCIHWFLISQSYDFEWDIFDAQYKVLDGIYRFSGVKADNHASRPVVLSKKYGIKLPKWAMLDSKGKKSELSKHRNELVHEAKYGGDPIGYSYPSQNYTLEFSAFNTKLIISALGINTPYLKADPGNCDQWGWDIKI